MSGPEANTPQYSLWRSVLVHLDRVTTSLERPHPGGGGESFRRRHYDYKARRSAEGIQANLNNERMNEDLCYRCRNDCSISELCPSARFAALRFVEIRLLGIAE